MKYINQQDYPEKPYITRHELTGEEYEKGQKTTVKSSACGLCAAIMVADRLLVNYKFDLDDAIQLSYETNANHLVGTDFRLFVPAFAEKLGLRYEATKNTDDLIRCLHTGGAAIALVGGDQDGKVGLFSHVGHYIVVINEEPDGRLAILDPSYNDGKYDEEGRQGKVELKNGRIELCSKEALYDDLKKKSVAPLYLFWRK